MSNKSPAQWRFIKVENKSIVYKIQNCKTEEYLTWDTRVIYSEKRNYIFTKILIDKQDEAFSFNEWLLKVDYQKPAIQILDSNSELFNLFSADFYDKNKEKRAFVWTGNNSTDWNSKHDNMKRLWYLLQVDS